MKKCKQQYGRLNPRSLVVPLLAPSKALHSVYRDPQEKEYKKLPFRSIRLGTLWDSVSHHSGLYRPAGTNSTTQILIMYTEHDPKSYRSANQRICLRWCLHGEVRLPLEGRLAGFVQLRVGQTSLGRLFQASFGSSW